MARRSDHTKDEIRAMVITSGKKIMAEEGFAGFSTRKIAREIGYTVGTLYNLFDGYDDIVLHINAATLDDMQEYILEKADVSLTGKAAIKQLAEYYLQFASEHYPSWSALFEHNLPPDVPLPDWFSERINALFAIVEQPLNAGDSEKAERAAKTIWASIHGICALGLTRKLDIVGAESIQILADNLIDNYFIGYEAGSV